jgi:hypothetical protein
MSVYVGECAFPDREARTAGVVTHGLPTGGSGGIGPRRDVTTLAARPWRCRYRVSAHDSQRLHRYTCGIKQAGMHEFELELAVLILDPTTEREPGPHARRPIPRPTIVPVTTSSTLT